MSYSILAAQRLRRLYPQRACTHVRHKCVKPGEDRQECAILPALADGSRGDGVSGGLGRSGTFLSGAFFSGTFLGGIGLSS
jgi:hypothetical protein